MHHGSNMQSNYSFIHLAWTVCGIITLWIASYVGYIVILPAFGISLSYAHTPLLSTAYYGAWVAVALLLFPTTIARVHLEQSTYAYIALAGFISFAALFYSIILPTLSGYGEVVGQSGNFFLGATQDFFLPKMTELVFQQILITALILSIASFDNNVLFVSLAYMVLFVLGHAFILLETSAGFVGLYALGAMLSAIAFPFLILRVRNGFVYTFMLHWLFYMGLTVYFLM